MRPELLLYGALAAEMHMRGALPGVGAMRSPAQRTPGLGMTVTGRDVKSGVMHAVRGTQTCVRAVSSAVERARMLPFVFSSARPSRTASGVTSPHPCMPLPLLIDVVRFAAVLFIRSGMAMYSCARQTKSCMHMYTALQ